MRFTVATLLDNEPDFETVPTDCRVMGYDVHALADAFIDWPDATSGASVVTPADDKQIDAWIIRAREIADDIWLRELNVCKRPSKEGIAPEIARRLWAEGIVTKKGKRIEAAYVERFALRNGWTPPEPD